MRQLARHRGRCPQRKIEGPMERATVCCASPVRCRSPSRSTCAVNVGARVAGSCRRGGGDLLRGGGEPITFRFAPVRSAQSCVLACRSIARSVGDGPRGRALAENVIRYNSVVDCASPVSREWKVPRSQLVQLTRLTVDVPHFRKTNKIPNA
jgi:hypothetical protein